MSCRYAVGNDRCQYESYTPINGVVKADQLDASSVWQELDEFVVTRELNKHINDLVAVLLSTIESEANAPGKNGIWVSGFFGCGKSHLIKDRGRNYFPFLDGRNV